MKKHFFLGRAIALAALATLLVIFVPTFYSFANSSEKLNDSQVQSLKSLGISIAVPSYIPQGYTVDKVTIRDASNDWRGYSILYSNSERTCFYISGNINPRGASIYEEPFKYSFPVVTRLLGETPILFGDVDNPEAIGQVPSPQQLNSPQSLMISGFELKIANGISVEYDVGTETEEDGCSANRSLTPLEMEKILQSLTWL